jgi:hypothetical protein
MAYIQPALPYFTHGEPYERGGCERCKCATLNGTNCRRKTCQHRRCCWQHSRSNNNAVYDSLTSYSSASPQERANADSAFHQRQYDSILTRKRQLQDAGANTRLVNEMEAAYRKAHAEGTITLLHITTEGFEAPPLHVRPVDLTDPAIKGRLVRYWEYYANAKNDWFQNEFADMSLDELMSVVYFDRVCFLAYSRDETPDLIKYWKSRLESHSPVVHPINTWKAFTQQDLNHIMDVARRINNQLARPFRQLPPDYPDGATFLAPTVFYLVPGMIPEVRVYFYKLRIVDASSNIIELGLVPQFRDPADNYTDGSVVVTNIGRLWRNHRLFQEPVGGFPSGFVGFVDAIALLNLRVHLRKPFAYWLISTFPYIDVSRLRLMESEMRAACIGLAP